MHNNINEKFLTFEFKPDMKWLNYIKGILTQKFL